MIVRVLGGIKMLPTQVDVGTDKMQVWPMVTQWWQRPVFAGGGHMHLQLGVEQHSTKKQTSAFIFLFFHASYLSLL